MEPCCKASRGELITHTSTISNDGPQSEGLWLKLCLNIKSKMDELSSDVLVGNKPSTLQISRVVAHGASLGYLVAL